MQVLLEIAARIAPRLLARGDTVAVAESASGGLISAALLSVPGASGYFRGGDIIYTASSRAAFGITGEDMHGMRSASEPYARLLAQRARLRLHATWGLAETGAAGPSGNRYGDPAGHACLAVAGPVAQSRVIATGKDERFLNMQAFAESALLPLEAALA
jgi:PncC family amidohydrolase